jgi:hypothetical protein
VTLAVSGAGNDIGVSAVSRLEVNAATLSASTAGAAGDDIFVLDTLGGLVAGLITAGSGDVDLSVVNGSLTSGTVDGTADIVGDSVTLAVSGAGNDIGASSASRLEINATTLSASTSLAAGNDINVEDTAGGLVVGLVTAGAGDVNLTARSGSLVSETVDGTPDIVGATVNLAVTGAGSDIGVDAANRLEINATTAFNASTAGAAGDDIFVVDTTGGLVAGLITAGAGDVDLLVQNGSLTGDADGFVADIVGDTVNLAVTGAGTESINALLSANTVNASTDGAIGEDIFFSDLSGDLAIGLVNAGVATVGISVENGSLTSATVDGTADIVAGRVSLGVGGSGNTIGESLQNRLEIDATTLAAGTAFGNQDHIFIVDTAGGVTIDTVDAGSSTVAIRAENGNITSSVVDGNADIFGGSLLLSTTGGGSVGAGTTDPLEVAVASIGTDVGSSVGGDISVLDLAGGLTLNSMTAGGGVQIRSTEGLTLGSGSITAGAGENIVLSAEGLAFPVINQGLDLNVSGGGKWFIYSTSPKFNTPPILSVGGILTFGGLVVNQLTFEKTLAADPPGTFSSGEGNMVFSLPDGGDDFDEIAKFFGDFIPVEDYRAVSISFGDYDPTKFGEVGDLWLSSSELYEEERKAGKAPRVAPEKIERMKFLIRGK